MKYNYRKNTAAVALICANRPDYLKQVIDSVAPQLGDRTFYLFADITPDQNTDIQEEQIQYTLDKIPDAKIIQHESHQGCGLNMIGARRYVFDFQRHPQAFILEDDLVLSDGYFNLCENIMKWCSSRYPNVGVVQGWNEAKESKNGITDNPFKLEDVACHWWAYLQTYQSWMTIRNIIYSFEDIFLRHLPKYNNRNHQEIMKWKQHIYNQLLPNRQQYGPSFFPETQGELLQRKSKMVVTGQDAVTLMSMYLTCQTRVAPMIARGLPIGEHGEHFSPEIFQKNGFDKLSMYNNPEDHTNTDFSVGGKVNIEMGAV